MSDLTWYSREGADQRFLTKGEAADLATKAESTQGDAALSGRIDAVKVTAEAALPSATASSTYATKSEVEEVRQLAQRAGQAQPAPQPPAPAQDLSPYLKSADAASTYATKSEMQSADTALGQRIDSVSGVATAAATKAELASYATKEELASYATSTAVAGTYATKESLAGYLKATDASDTYATKAQLAQAQLGGAQNAPDLSGLATKAEMRQADQALGARIDQVKAAADSALPKTDAASTYATKADVSSADSALGTRIDAVKKTADAALPTATAASTYATKTEVAAAKSAADGALSKTEAASKYAAKTDLSAYATTTSVASTYATKESVTSATAPISGLQSKVSSLETAVGSKADSSALSGLLPKADAATTYATKSEVAAVRAAIPQVPAAPDLSPYLRTADAETKYASKADLAKAQAGGKVDLSGYLTAADAANTYSTKVQVAAMGDSIRAGRAVADAALPKTEAAQTYATKAALSTVESKATDAASKAATAVQPAALAAYATAEALAKVQKTAEDAAATVVPPFRSGERYSSPVTYYWPDYYNEKAGTSKWAKALKAGGTLGIVILNRNSGNWDEKNEDFGKQAARALAAGARRAVFYVKTQYGVASLPSNDPARNGVPNPDKYTKEYILGQIAKFTEQYGEVAQGVFLDETINGWGDQAGRVAWYKDLINSIRGQYGQNFYIVVNAGSNMSPEMCALDFDTAMMFEQDAKKFLTEDPNAPILPDHMRAYPSEKWWAVIHGVTKDNYRQVFEKLDTLPIGHAYITDGVLVEDPNRGGQWEPVGNPYENPPSEQLIKLTSAWIRGTLGLALEVEDLKAQIAALKKAAPAGGQAGKVLVLGPNDPLPQGLGDDTVVIRREA